MRARWTHFVTALLMPLIGMAFLFNQNVAYLSGWQVLLAALAMALLSALGYAVLYALFRSDASALFGALAFWAMFFAGGGALRGLLERFAPGKLPLVGVMACTGLVVLLIAFALRKHRGSAMGTFALLMAIVMTLMNVPQAALSSIQIETHQVDESLIKTDFSVDAALPSPNIYWFHTDGMLGFTAFQTYFGDDQAAFRESLTKSGFDIDAGAMMETGHSTAVTVPSLLSPSFYDRVIAARAQTHDQFMALRADKVFMTNEAQLARYDLEALRAFEQKGYKVDLISSLDIYFPPTYDRLYKIDSQPEVRLLSMEDPKRDFMPMQQSIELSKVLWRASGGLSLGLPEELINKQIMRHPVRFEKVKQQIGDERIDELLLNGRVESSYRNLFIALDDALRSADQPRFTVVFYPSAHYPFKLKADGSPAEGDTLDIANYAGNHQYSARVLENAVNMILQRDPNAVIVLQADHGLHGVSGKRIVEYTGDPDAAIPIWNQVMSAIRVPEEYKGDDEQHALENPLNMSRYLMNRFVGESYPYLPASTMP